MSKKYVGKVSTDVVGSTVEFEVSDDFEDLDEEKRHKDLLESMWGSGMVNVWYEEV